jgi:hypothetical protein
MRAATEESIAMPASFKSRSSRARLAITLVMVAGGLALGGCGRRSSMAVSRLRDVDPNYTGSIRVSLAHPSTGDAYQLVFAVMDTATELGICDLVSGPCSRDASGWLPATDVSSGAGAAGTAGTGVTGVGASTAGTGATGVGTGTGKKFFKASGTTTLSATLNLDIVAYDSSGQEMDRRRVAFAAAPGAGAAGGGTTP